MNRHVEESPERGAELKRVELLQRDAEAELLRAGLSTSHLFAEGDPRHLLVKTADEWGAECVFVGSHGRGRFERLFIGSVASAVAARAHCSVEIVRAVEPRD